MLRMSALVGLLALAANATGQQMNLDYLGRYQDANDHIMDAVALNGDRALVTSKDGLTLLDLNALPVSGNSAYVSKLFGVEGRDVYLSADERFAFINTHRGSTFGNTGFTVVEVAGDTLTQVATVNEPGILYEKMALVGDTLYVTAHAFGLRVYDVSDATQPTLIGQLGTGFVDAFAVAVEGSTAYVADGGGGLKVVDVSDPTAPAHIEGETLATSIGTSEDVTVRDGRIYVAAGGAGLAVYEVGQLGSRTTYPAGACAESICWVGDHLVVGSFSRSTVFEVGAGTSVTQVAFEASHRGGTGTSLRIAEGVAEAPGNRLLVANWVVLDVYELKPASESTQPDINCSAQRIRFSPSGGTKTVSVSNNGQGTLTVDTVNVNNPNFTVGWSGGDLAPGESVSFDITYQDTGTATGTGVVSFFSNDPNENPLPVQVFGATPYLDPGEQAPDFTLGTLEQDASGQLVQGAPFTLSGQEGKIVWFAVFGTW